MKLHITEPESKRYGADEGDRGFNRRFDPESGNEGVSYLVKPNSTSSWCLDHAAKSSDPKGMLAYFILCFLGQANDITRVQKVGIRILPDSQDVEVRLTLGPPWWWDQARQHFQLAVAGV